MTDLLFEKYHGKCWEKMTAECGPPLGTCLECMTRTARKEHECSWCDNPIKKGQKYIRLVVAE